MPEAEVLDSFHPFTARRLPRHLEPTSAQNTNHVNSAPKEDEAVPQRRTKHLSREEALDLFPIGTRGIKTFGNQDFQGQVYSFLDGMWRVRYVDNDWEDLTRAQMERFVRRRQDGDTDFRVD